MNYAWNIEVENGVGLQHVDNCVNVQWPMYYMNLSEIMT